MTTWLYRVVANLCIDRRRRARGGTVTLDAIPEPADGRASVVQTMQERARADALQAALNELPARQRQAVVLRHIEGLSNPEIAEIMNHGRGGGKPDIAGQTRAGRRRSRDEKRSWDMPMTGDDHDDRALDAFFDAARRTAPAPSDDMLARVLADAESVQATAHAPAPRHRAMRGFATCSGRLAGDGGAGDGGAGRAVDRDGLPERVLGTDDAAYLVDITPEMAFDLIAGGTVMTDRQPITRDGRLMRIVLVASLALNLLVVGLAAGWALRHAGDPHPPSRLDMAGGPLTRALSPEDRHEIARRMRKAWRAADGGRADLRDSYDALVADLRAVPFDPASVSARMRQHRERFAIRFEMGQDVLVTHLSNMSDDNRSAYADRLEERIRAYRAARDHRPED